MDRVDLTSPSLLDRVRGREPGAWQRLVTLRLRPQLAPHLARRLQRSRVGVEAALNV